MDAQQLGGFLDAAVGPLHRLVDGPALQLLQGHETRRERPRRDGGARRIVTQPRREQVGRQARDVQPLHPRGQLPDVPRPDVALERAHHDARQRDRRAAVSLGEVREEVPQQGLDVLRAIAQRRDVDPDDVDPVVQVLTELPLLDEPPQVAVGRRDEPRCRLLGARGADGQHFALLKDAKQLGLHPRRDVPHLVEEQRPHAGGADQAEHLALGTREGAADVPEELALEDALADARAVDGDEGLRTARRPLVQPPGHQLLAGAALALDQDGAGAPGYLVDQLNDVANRVGPPDQRMAGPRTQCVRHPEGLLQRAPLRSGGSTSKAPLSGTRPNSRRLYLPWFVSRASPRHSLHIRRAVAPQRRPRSAPSAAIVSRRSSLADQSICLLALRAAKLGELLAPACPAPYTAEGYGFQASRSSTPTAR